VGRAALGQVPRGTWVCPAVSSSGLGSPPAGRGYSAAQCFASAYKTAKGGSCWPMNQLLATAGLAYCACPPAFHFRHDIRKAQWRKRKAHGCTTGCSETRVHLTGCSAVSSSECSSTLKMADRQTDRQDSVLTGNYTAFRAERPGLRGRRSLYEDLRSYTRLLLSATLVVAQLVKAMPVGHGTCHEPPAVPLSCRNRECRGNS
jgi:hypothetical protein